MTYDELVVQCDAAAEKAGEEWRLSLPREREKISMAQAITRAIIPIVQEACAQVADRYASNFFRPDNDLQVGYTESSEEIAQAIRNMGAGS